LYFRNPMNIKPAIYFAPFQGITTLTFRSVYARHFQGVDKLFTPYFSNFAAGYTLPSKKQLALRNQSENGIEVVPQILSKSHEEITWFAHSCEELGFKELNWNLGCPYPQVANKKRGSGILPYPEIIDEILEKVMQQVNLRFSVKCRLGHHSSDEMNALVPVFNRYPINELTIHARIGKQLYSGQTDLKAFGSAAAHLKAPLVYNGDIFSITDFQNFMQLFPQINLLMLGRGILYDPFLPTLIKGLEIPEDPKAHVRKFTDELYYAYRKEREDNPSVLNAMKEYWAYLSLSFSEPLKVFRKLKKAKNFDAWEEAINYIFENYEWAGSGK
jgi:tRNA-dihydrouridine synthase B